MPDHNILNTKEPFLRLEKKSEFLHLIFILTLFPFVQSHFVLAAYVPWNLSVKTSFPLGLLFLLLRSFLMQYFD